MVKILVFVALLIGVLPMALSAAAVENKKNVQQVSPEAELMAFRQKLAQDPKLTDAQRDAILSERMKQLQGGGARSEKNTAVAQRPAQRPVQAQTPVARKPAPPAQVLAVVQAVRPQSKVEGKPAQSKSNVAEKISERNVLVH